MATNEPNSFERVARMAKVTRIVRELDYQLRLAGGDPNHDPARVVAMLVGWPEQNWKKLAIVAGAKPPSDITKAAIIADYQARAARVIETTAEDLSVAS
jgi:hypothetical protein